MNVWKQASYLGIIAVIALCAAIVSAQEKKEEVKGDAKKGQTVFEANCQICHNADSEETKVGPGLKGWSKKPPHKFGDKEHTHNADTLRNQIKNGGGQMPPMGSMVADKDLEDLVAYVMSL